jgi:hypothetical protein
LLVRVFDIEKSLVDSMGLSNIYGNIGRSPAQPLIRAISVSAGVASHKRSPQAGMSGVWWRVRGAAPGPSSAHLEQGMSFLHIRFSPVWLAMAAGFWLAAAACQAADIGTSGAVRRFDPNIDLPQSSGVELVLRACTGCHELGGLSAYKGYWNRDQWMEMVVGMVKNGAELLPQEQELVADYLTRHFGPGTRKGISE